MDQRERSDQRPRVRDARGRADRRRQEGAHIDHHRGADRAGRR